MAGASWAAAEPSGAVAQLLAAGVDQKALTWTKVAWSSMAAAVLARAWKQGTAGLLRGGVQLEAQVMAGAGPGQRQQRVPGGGRPSVGCLLCVMLPSWCCEVLPPSCNH